MQYTISGKSYNITRDDIFKFAKKEDQSQSTVDTSITSLFMEASIRSNSCSPELRD